MKKIGTMTFHRSLNYGSVLQTFALQQVIKKIDRECTTEVIDFYPPGIDKIRSVFVPTRSLRNFLHNVVSVIYYPAFVKRKSEFDTFLKKNVKLSEKKYQANSDMSNLGKEYDCLIAGSDQIWNNRTADFSIQYFFPQANNVRKISYAPSLGNGLFELPRDQQIYEALSEFNAISAREISGARKLKNFINDLENVPVVLDPTLLLVKEDYKLIESEAGTKWGKYIFLYSVNMDRRTLEIAKVVSHKTGLPVISIYTTNASFRTYKYGIKLSRDTAPGDFLSLLHHAELVISDSFHGTAFSVNYHKKFFSICDNDPEKRDPRLDTILSKLQLSHRMLFFDNHMREDYLEQIDYTLADEQLHELRRESLNYLQGALKEESNS